MARYGFFDPDATLNAAVEDAAAPRELPVSLRETLKTLGGRIFGWLVWQLRVRQVKNPYSEAQDLLQQFCIRVFAWIRGNGPGVAEPWFWTVAKNVYINHLDRELVKKRDPEQQIDWDAEETAWLLGRLNGSLALEEKDHWIEARFGALIRRCVRRLPPREQEFLRYDLVLRLSGPELDKALGLKPKSRAALKANALRDLRAEILRELEKGPEPLELRRARSRPKPGKDG